MRNLTLFGLLVLLSACGGHDHDAPPVQKMPPPTTGGTAAPDSFVAQVAALVATRPDDTEAAALDASAPTMPENTEPQPVTP